MLKTIPVGNTLGECILWDDRSRSAWWTDIHAAVLYRYAHATSSLQRYELPERLCSFGFTDNDDRLVCAFASGFALYSPTSGELGWLYRPEKDFRGTRFNDGRVDRQGRFWSGTMVEGDARDAAGGATKGSLYWIRGGERHKALGGIAISNSLCWSVDGSILYFADSPTRRIMAYAFDRATGELGGGKLFADTSGDGEPDGSVVDADGFLWNARWGASKIARHAPTGEVDAELDLPVSQPTCICFGGEDLDLLFVSTAREGLSPESLESQPQAGHVLVYRTAYRGLREDRYRL